LDRVPLVFPEKRWTPNQSQKVNTSSAAMIMN
jgi:hypothetical protein